MQIYLNGQAVQIDSTTTLAQLLSTHGYAERRVAVEVNRSIVPKSQHGSFQFHDNDKLEIVHALGGG
jgi:sulfur carrier protein